MGDEVSLKPFKKEDVPLKVNWINDSENNEFLHYDLPLTVEKTEKWWDTVKDRQDRKDFVIYYNDIPVGLTGLIDIDRKNCNAQIHIVLGNISFKKRGISSKALQILLEYAFNSDNLNKLFLYVDNDNEIAKKLYEKVGFTKEGLLKEHMVRKGQFIDRCIYGITRKYYEGNK